MIKKIKVGKKFILAFQIGLSSKNFILLKGSKGYIMCGYLNLQTANKFKDAAVKICGANDIESALESRVCSLSRPAARLGIYKGQRVRDVLKIIV